MSRWHREHPELVGTEADPWMDSPGYAEAHAKVVADEQERERLADPRIHRCVYDEDDPERGYFGEESEEYESGERREGAQYVVMCVNRNGDTWQESRHGNNLRAAVDACNAKGSA